MKIVVKKARLFVTLAGLALAGVVHAAEPSFAGSWTFSPENSQNIGMMAAIKQTAKITQTAKELVVSESSVFQGQVTDRKYTLNLTGKKVPNEGPMGAKAETESKWDGGNLVTTWTSEGAVAGSQTVRTETRSLSSDGKRMIVKTVRGENKPVVMVYEKTE